MATRKKADASAADSSTAVTAAPENSNDSPSTCAAPASSRSPTGALVIQGREEIQREMLARLKGMMATVQAGVRSELAELNADLRDGALLDLAARLTAVNDQLAARPHRILIPSLRSRVRVLEGILSGILFQMGDGATEEEAAEQAAAFVRELVPNSRAAA